MIHTRKIAAIAASAAITVLCFGNSAHAATPADETHQIVLAGCYVDVHIEAQGSPPHDYLLWETDGDSDGCYVEVTENDVVIARQLINTTGNVGIEAIADFDDNLQVCVENPEGAWACWPTS